MPDVTIGELPEDTALTGTELVPVVDGSTTKRTTVSDLSDFVASELGTAAVVDVPASGDAATGEAVLGSDTRLSNSRAPTGHASTHATGGADPIIPALIGAAAVDSTVLAAPDADSDADAGYYVMDSVLYDGVIYDCYDNTNGAAIWTPRSGGVTTVTSHAPGSTLTLTLTDGSSHLVTLSEDCAITLASSVADGTVEHAELDLDRQGYTVTWANLDQGEGDLDLSGAAGVVENLAVRVTYVSSAAYFHAIQYGAAGAGTALPATGLQAVHRLESDATDSVNSNDLTLQASASIVGSGQHGLSLASASSQYASRASAIIDPGADFTWVGAFANIDTAPGTDEAIVSWGSSSGGDPYLVLRWNVTGTLYAQAKDDTGANGSPASIAIGSLPADDMLVMLARNGSTLVLKCLSNGVTSNGTFPAGGMTCDQFALGCRMKGTPAFDWFYNGGSSRPILADAMWDRYVSGTTEQNQVRQWFIDDRGLSGV